MMLPGGAVLDFGAGPLVMAIVNCNGDSFYPPSRARGTEAVEKALAALDAGADIVDVGGESTRPGAAYISAGEEMDRVIPVIEGLRKYTSLPLSVDTRKAAVARAALDAGAGIINDISALADDPEMTALCASRKAVVVLMHGAAEHQETTRADRHGGGPALRGTAERGGERSAASPDFPGEVFSFLLNAAAGAEGRGIDREKIILDPGVGFGKTLEDNLMILNRLAEICASGYPVLVGLSRKRFVRALTGRDAAGALAGTLAAEAFCVFQGASILRVHDTAETVDLVRVLREIGGKGTAGGMVSVPHFSL
ncbi:MAG: dihydropteroate synthase [Treponema sp.]|jgi:dihydropteroate synthase|nr:dihydropteroate synthase [Treponema sp.]